MKKLLILLTLSLFLSSCGSSKSASSTKVQKTEKSVKSASKTKANKIVSYAKTFKGTPYKFGGTSKKGMDCSGLVFTAFGKEDILLPRISRDMAKSGKPISLSNSTEGDLVFFKTSKSKKGINHVGLIVDSKKGEVFFIHSTTSRGVIISSLEEDYWKRAFVEARRIM